MVGQDVERPFAYGFHTTPALWVFVPLAIGLAIAPHTQIAAVASFFAVLIALIFRRTLLVFLLILPLAVLYRRSFDRKDAFFDQLVGERVKVRIKVLSPLKCEISEILTDSGFAPFGARIGYSGIKLPEGTRAVGEGVIMEAPRWRYQMTGLHYVLDFEAGSSISPKPSFRTKVREAIKSTIEEAAWDSVNSALMTAFLLGERYEVPYELRNAFRRCGVYHLFAISGLHVGLLFTILLAITMFLRIPRRVAIALSGCVMGLYGYLVGFSPSIMRALLMLWSFTAAMIASKRASTLNVLAFSGVLTLLLRPYYIENLGFQLSYLATFGILLYLPARNSMKREVAEAHPNTHPRFTECLSFHNTTRFKQIRLHLSYFTNLKRSFIDGFMGCTCRNLGLSAHGITSFCRNSKLGCRNHETLCWLSFAVQFHRFGHQIFSIRGSPLADSRNPFRIYA